MSNPRIISQAKLAEALGLSRATISYALSDSSRVALETRERVRRASAKLGYRPNIQARQLRRSRSNLVGVACGPITDSYQAQLIDALERELWSRGLLMLTRSIMLGSPEEAWERTLEFVDNRACGIIFQCYSDLHARLAETYPRMFALVNIGTPNPNLPSISCDFDAAGRAVAQHLLSLGRKRWATNVTKSRFDSGQHLKTRAFVQAAMDAGLPAPVEVLLEGDYFESHLGEYGQIVAQSIMQRHPDVDAIYFSCDDIAQSGMAWLQREGYRVPEDVAVVGFNDAPYAASGVVPLTTIRQPAQLFARLAVEMLIEQMENDNQLSLPGREIECELVIRKSTDPAYRPPQPQAPPGSLRFLNQQTI